MNTLTWPLYKYVKRESGKNSVASLCANFHWCESMEELSTMFKDMAKVFHPDMRHAPDDVDTRMMQYITSEYDIAKRKFKQ